MNCEAATKKCGFRGIMMFLSLFKFFGFFAIVLAFLAVEGCTAPHQKGDAETETKQQSLLGADGRVFYFASTNKHILVPYLGWQDIETGRQGQIDINAEIFPLSWDIRGSFLAASCYTNRANQREFKIFDLNTLKPIMSLKGPILRAAISPDCSKVAVLTPVKEDVLLKRKHSIVMIGTICSLKVFEVPSGRLVATCPRLALGNGSVSWRKNSSNVIFQSASNETALLTEAGPLPSGYSYVGVEDTDPIGPVVLDWNVPSNMVSYVTQGLFPTVAEDADMVLYRRGGRLYSRNLCENTKEDIVLKKIHGGIGFVASPNGKYLLLEIHALYYALFPSPYRILRVVRISDGKSYIIEEKSQYDVRWRKMNE